MDAEMLTRAGTMVVGFAIAVIAGRVFMRTVFGMFESLMDAISPGAWLTILVVALVAMAFFGGFLSGIALP